MNFDFFRSNQNVEGYRLIDYEGGIDDDVTETFDTQNKDQGKNNSKQKGKSKEKKNNNQRTMNGQGGSTSQLTSPVVSGSGRPTVDRFPSYSSDIESGNVRYSPDGKVLMNTETKDNIKCIVTSSLFIAIIILVFVMMFTINPAE